MEGRWKLGIYFWNRWKWKDYFARILYGTRISLTIGFGAACVGMIIGVTLGVCAVTLGLG